MPGRPRPVPGALRGLALRQAGLVAARQCVQHGMSREQIAARVRSSSWAQVVSGVYDTGIRPDDDPFDLRRRGAAHLGLLAHPGSVATGLCALALHRVQGLPVDLVPEVTMPTGAPRAPRPPVRLHRIALDRWETVDGFPAMGAPEALALALPRLSRYHAVAIMDSLLRRDLLDDATIARLRAASGRRQGAARTRTWWDQADGRAESPAETWARLSCVDAGCPPDALQLDVADGNDRVFARVDLAWRLPDGGALFLEIDGRDVHTAPAAVFADRARQNRLVTTRTLLLRFTGRDAWNGRVGVEVRALLLDAGWRPSPVPPSTVFRIR